MPERTSITSQIQREENLRLLSNAFLSFSNDPDENISKLIASFGEMLGATCCLYNKVHTGQIHTVTAWNVPAGYASTGKADGHICTDMIRSGRTEGYILINDLEDSQYGLTDPAIRAFGWQTFFGQVVELSGQPVGSVCALFTSHFTPSKEDGEIIGIISSAIRTQESLRHKIGEIRDREHKLQALIDNSPNVAIQFYDAHGRVKYWNKASETFYGFSEQDTRGRSLA